MDLMTLVPDFKTVPNSRHSPRVEHVCEMPTEESPLTMLIPGSSTWSRLRRWFLSMRIAYRRHPFTRWCLKSDKAFHYEISRHIQSYPYMIHPFSAFSKRHLKLTQQLRQYMRHKELPHFLQRRLLTYYNHRNKKGLERDKQIMKYVSPYLREKLLLHNYTKLFNNVELFRHLPQIVVTQLADVLHTEIFITNDALIRAGTRGDALYIIASGTVAIFNNVGKEICHLEDGAYFGEIALVMEDEWRIASVVAVENCEVHVLSRINFQRVLTPYPDLLAHLQNVALAFLEQTLSLEEAYELDSSVLASVKINISSIKTKRRH